MVGTPWRGGFYETKPIWFWRFFVQSCAGVRGCEAGGAVGQNCALVGGGGVGPRFYLRVLSIGDAHDYVNTVRLGFSDTLDAMGDRHSFNKSQCHRALIARQKRSVGQEDLPRHAPLIRAGVGCPAGEPFRCVVEIGQPAFGVRRVDGHKKGVNLSRKASYCPASTPARNVGSAGTPPAIISHLRRISVRP